MEFLCMSGARGHLNTTKRLAGEFSICASIGPAPPRLGPAVRLALRAGDATVCWVLCNLPARDTRDQPFDQGDSPRSQLAKRSFYSQGSTLSSSRGDQTADDGGWPPCTPQSGLKSKCPRRIVEESWDFPSIGPSTVQIIYHDLYFLFAPRVQMFLLTVQQKATRNVVSLRQFGASD
jgi:hypothetical protein